MWQGNNVNLETGSWANATSALNRTSGTPLPLLQKSRVSGFIYSTMANECHNLLQYTYLNFLVLGHCIECYSVLFGAAPDANREFCTSADPIALDPHDFQGSMRLGTDESDTDCWTSPDGSGFKIRGKTYLRNNGKVETYWLLMINIIN